MIRLLFARIHAVTPIRFQTLRGAGRMVSARSLASPVPDVFWRWKDMEAAGTYPASIVRESTHAYK